MSKELGESSTRNNRFGSALMDWEDIKKRPILGSSRRIEVITGTTVITDEMRRPNGLTNFFREYGLVYFSVYFVLVLISFKTVLNYHGNFNRMDMAVFGIALLWIGAFSELVFDLVFFKALIFLAHTYRHNPQEESYNQPALS